MAISKITANAISAGAIGPEALAAAAQYNGFKNRIINGDMRTAQRGTSVSVQNSPTFLIDRWIYRRNGTWTTASFTYSQESISDLSGFTSALKFTVVGSEIVSGEQFASVEQTIEGYNIADFAFGTADASNIAVSFWVKGSVPGIYCMSLASSQLTNEYVTEYTINSANTWERKTIVVPGPTVATWNSTNQAGITIRFTFAGSLTGALATPTKESWDVNLGRYTTAQTSISSTEGATWQVTGVQLEKGSTATSFDYRPYGTELALCQRYYYRINGNGTFQTALSFGGYSSSTTLGVGFNQFPVTMRTAPTSMEQSGTASHYAWRGAGSNVTFSGVPTWSDNTTANIAAYTGTVSSGLTAGQSIYTRSLSDSGFLAWSAEL
jgi:hypothetical protein